MNDWIVEFSNDYGNEQTLTCPECSEGYLHHDTITVYSRSEDETATFVSEIGHKTTVAQILPSSKTNNPSARRSGLSIGFWCETCDFRGTLKIAQHKGNTNVWWSR